MAIIVYVLAIAIVPITYFFLRIVPKIVASFKLRSELLRLIPADKPHWLYGHLHVFPGVNEEGLQTLCEWTKKYPRYYGFAMGPLRLVIQLNHPETIKQLTKTSAPKTDFYSFFLPWIGEGLLVANGAKWHRNRKMLTHGFHFDVLKPYIDVYNDCLDIIIEGFNKDSVLTKSSVDIFQPVSRCALDIILRCAFSTSKDIQTDKDNAYLKTVLTLSKQIVDRGMTPYLFPDMIYYATRSGKQFLRNCEFSNKVASDIIDERRKKLDNKDNNKPPSKSRYVDFLDILLLAKDSDGNGLSRQEILDEVETFMFEGHDTTTSGISWALYNLARHPDIQRKAQCEIDALLDGRDSDRLTWQDMSELPYLTQCIKESLRTHPPVPFFGRMLTEPMPLDDVTLPIGSFVDINVWNLHHNPQVWADPMTYDPERFSPDNVAKMDSHAFLPFSAGSRNCIGQNFAMNEMKTTLARMLRRFDMKVDETKEVRKVPDLILRAETGLYLYFQNRQFNL